MAKILLVEDDINLREIYAARLGAEKYEVVTASDGEEALAKAVKDRPDLILLDVMMPKISGFDVLDILRSTPETKATRVVMLTALSQKIDRARGEKLGVDRYLVKSQITLEDVVQSITELLERATPPKNPPEPPADTKDTHRLEKALNNLKTGRIRFNPKEQPAADQEAPSPGPSGA